MYAETHGPSCRVWAYSLRTIQYSACLCVCHSSYARTNLMIWFHTSLLNSDNSYWCLGKISCKWPFVIICYPPDSGVECCDEPVCLSVCCVFLSAIISSELHLSTCPPGTLPPAVSPKALSLVHYSSSCTPRCTT